MSTLWIRLAGPMQSWGTRSSFGHRDTELEPSKSGVIGLLGAALGRERSASWNDLAALRMAVRIDAPGTVQCDFQTAMDVAKAGGGTQTVLSNRFYLSGASFLVGLAGSSRVLGLLDDALAHPRWPLFLGRKGFAPSPPPRLPDGLRELSLADGLREVDWKGDTRSSRVAVVECEPDEPGDVRMDVPHSFAWGAREYGPRRVRRVEVWHAQAEQAEKEVS